MPVLPDKLLNAISSRLPVEATEALLPGAAIGGALGAGAGALAPADSGGDRALHALGGGAIGAVGGGALASHAADVASRVGEIAPGIKLAPGFKVKHKYPKGTVSYPDPALAQRAPILDAPAGSDAAVEEAIEHAKLVAKRLKKIQDLNPGPMGRTASHSLKQAFSQGIRHACAQYHVPYGR